MRESHTAFAAESHTASVGESTRRGDLRRAFDLWLSDGKAQGWSEKTVADRKTAVDRFMWWLENEHEAPLTLRSLTPATVRAFLSYAREPRPGGRYGSDRTSACREAKPATVNAYFRILRAFSNFAVQEGLIESTPLKNVKAPKIPKDQVQPLTQEQLQGLMDAARRGRNPERDGALILLLTDTGLRVSELCSLRVGQTDRGTGELTVIGKGGKKRTVCMGVNARRALWRYLETPRRKNATPSEALFASTGGTDAGGGLTESGVFRIVANCGAIAGIRDVRVSPHTLRHSFAVTFLRNGGNLFELQSLMGHEDLTILRRYVLLAEQDLSAAHRAASPGDRLRLK